MEQVSENYLRSFKSIAHVIERKLLEMQIALVAHQQPLRFVHIEYEPSLTPVEVTHIEERINYIYDLLQKFCTAYDLPKEKANLKNELAIKANFLWEDVTGATATHLRGHGALSESAKESYDKKIDEIIEAVNSLIQQFQNSLPIVK